MRKSSEIAMVCVLCVVSVIVGLVVYTLVISNGRDTLPVHLSINKKLIPAPEATVWVAALQHRVSPEQFEEIVKTNRQGRDYALGLFAHSGMTNHVLILIKYGADTSESALEALKSSGMTNAAALVRSVAKELNGSLPNNPAMETPD